MPPNTLQPTPEELEELRLRRRASQLKGYGEGADDPTAQALLNVRRNLGEAGRAVVGAKPYDETNPTGSYRAVQALMNAPTPAAIIPEAAQAAGKAATALSGLGALGVVKPKGGNWLADSIKYQLDKLKYHQNPESGLRYAQELFSDPALDEATRAGLMERIPEWEQQASLNKWIDTKFNKYVRNEMATPEDPLRALAERGVTLQGVRAPGPQTLNELEAVRGMEGFPEKGMAVTEAGRNWEAAADRAIYLNQAGDLTRTTAIRDNPWLSNLDPKTPVYEIGPRLGEFFEHTGFRHLIDELQAATAPNSTLPQSLRLTPEQLQKVTMPQAVELADKIGKWRASEAAKAEKAGMMENLKNKPREVDENFRLSFVDKPGGVWVDIPETTSKEGLKLCTAIGKQGGWCTQQESIAKAYGSGDDRLVALLDAEGRPHVQAKISSATPDATRTELGDLLSEEEALGDQFFRNVEAVLQQRQIDPNTAEAVMDYLAGGPRDQIPDSMLDQLNEIMVEAETMLPRRAITKPDITELKPVGNMFRNERAQEYGRRDPEYFRKVENAVLKFLNNGKWGEVKDLDLYGIVRIHPDSDLGMNLRAANVTAPEFVTQRQLSDLLDKYGRTNLPPSSSEGYAAGGAVRMKDGGKPPKRRASDLPGYGEGSAADMLPAPLLEAARAVVGAGPSEPTNPSEVYRIAQTLANMSGVAGAVGAVKRPAGAAAALRELLRTEAPAQSAAAREALRRAYRTGHEHSVVGLTEAGVPGEVVTSGNRTRVIPSAADVSRAVSDPQRRAIVDFHTHPSDVSGLRVSPSADDVAFYADYERGAWPRTLKTFIASPPSTGGGRASTAYSFFETDVPRRVYDKDLFEKAELELQNAGRLGRFDRVRRDPAFAVAFESGAVDLQDLLGEAAPLLLLERRAAQGAGRQRLDLGANAVAPNAELRDFYEMIREPAQEFLKKNKLKKGGAVKIETNPTLMADELLFKGHKRR